MGKPGLLLYCQHTLGMGHLVRSFALAEQLAQDFAVTLLNGGLLPREPAPPAGVEVVQLPALGMDDAKQLESRDSRYSVEQAQTLRRDLIVDAFDARRPRAIVIELFPFGRKKFADELLPLLQRARYARAATLCSLRDILVASRADQQRHDDRACRLANAYFDGILLHADPRFARLEESFKPSRPLTVPVHYTGFVAPRRSPAPVGREARLLVSAGGGLVGMPLYRAAVAAHDLLARERALAMTIVAGPFLPEAQWSELERLVAARHRITLLRSVPDLAVAMRAASASLSQCGYNSALDILHAGVPALVVPYAQGREDEQLNRARRLERLGALRVLPPQELDPQRLARCIAELDSFTPNSTALDFDGARRSAAVVRELCASSASRVGAPA